MRSLQQDTISYLILNIKYQLIHLKVVAVIQPNLNWFSWFLEYFYDKKKICTILLSIIFQRKNLRRYVELIFSYSLSLNYGFILTKYYKSVIVNKF
jgi:hypothetical protein